MVQWQANTTLNNRKKGNDWDHYGKRLSNCPFVEGVSSISEHSKVIKEQIIKVSSCSSHILFILSHNPFSNAKNTNSNAKNTNSNAVKDEEPNEQVQFPLLLNISIISRCMARRKYKWFQTSMKHIYIW